LPDAEPEAALAPAMIERVDILPGAETRREAAPGTAGLLNPEHGLHHLAHVMRGASLALAWARE
jgi:hypothetical protein